MKPQNPWDNESYEITLQNLGQIPPGEYKSYLLFNVNGQNYGDKITLKVVIKRNENLKTNLNMHLD